MTPVGDKYQLEWIIDVGGSENNPLSEVIDALEGRVKDSGGGECKSHKVHVADNSPEATGLLCFRQYLEHPYIQDLLKANVLTAEYAGKQYQKAQKSKELLMGAFSSAIASVVSKG